MYKVTQLMHFFYTKFSYKTVIVSKAQDNEIWMINPSNGTYAIIRITVNSIEQVIFEQERINETIKLLKHRLRLENAAFLDIHVGHDEILDDEIYDSVAIDSDYYDGKDINYAFPGIKNVVHEVEDQNSEIKRLVDDINESAQIAKQQKRRLNKIPLLVTYIVMAICLLNYLGVYLLKLNYDQISSMIVLGADYKMFTLGLGQFWRLLTYGFVHGGLLHLLMNMYSLYILGSFLEPSIGSKKYAFILLSSIIGGGLVNAIFSANSILVGISGGLYGLMAIYFISAYQSGYLNRASIIQIILLNLMINFMANVSILAHFGGFIVGVVSYLIFFDNKKRRYLGIILMVVFFIATSFKYFSNRTVRPIYGGTDAQVVKIYYDFGFENYSGNLTKQLFEAYQE